MVKDIKIVENWLTVVSNRLQFFKKTMAVIFCQGARTQQLKIKMFRAQFKVIWEIMNVKIFHLTCCWVIHGDQRAVHWCNSAVSEFETLYTQY